MFYEGVDFYQAKISSKNIKQKYQGNKKDAKQIMTLVLIGIGMITLLLSACSNDSIDTSPIKGVSDEVYEQLVQHYFFLSTQTDILIGDLETNKKGTEWFEDHELMDDAVAYAEGNDDIYSPTVVFPNPLMYEYHMDPGAYSEEEQVYLEKMNDFIDAANRAMLEDYLKLKKEVKDDLKINEADNMFDVS